MTIVQERRRPGRAGRMLAKQRLGVWPVVAIVGGAIAPLTTVAGATTTGWAVTGVVAVPLAYLVAAVLLMLFSSGYTAMTRHLISAGPLYTIPVRGLGRHVGVGAGAVTVLAYNILPAGLLGGFGAVARPLMRDLLGLSAPWWAWALAAWAVVAVLSVLNIVLVGRATAEGTDTMFNLAAPYVPGWFVTCGHVLFLTSLFAATLGFHNVAARYLYTLGRDGVLPARLSRTGSRNHAPAAASLAQTVIALVIVVLYAANGWDPLTKLFFQLVVVGGLGILMHRCCRCSPSGRCWPRRCSRSRSCSGSHRTTRCAGSTRPRSRWSSWPAWPGPPSCACAGRGRTRRSERTGPPSRDRGTARAGHARAARLAPGHFSAACGSSGTWCSGRTAA
ncbi:hypothetical protein Ade02nite_30630 [Paractinoplanes deccanensis]|uniref:Amino acid permease n=1 Tax=Paractinoplanes deccanensis TaxID=113561 RepID=A0ABQ3Y397_9ACTN|nr:APC family permease [Actinoplanes deccanensis]GID74422.1 hypothetical protein Ade02nite_30630 [Actinoplanes deccanensis]